MSMSEFGGPEGFYRGVKILEDAELMIRNIIARTETGIPLTTAEKVLRSHFNYIFLKGPRGMRHFQFCQFCKFNMYEAI